MASISSSSRARDLHAAPAAARRRLDQHRDSRCRGRSAAPRPRRRPRPPSRARRGCRACVAVRLASILSPISRICSALRADEGDAVLGENVGEAGVLRQEAVARMHGVGAGDLAGRQQRGHVEVAFARRRRADADALVGELDVHRLLVGGRIDRDRGDAELLGRAHDAQRDLAAVGDQDLVEHLTRSPSTAGRIRPASRPRRRSSMILPARGATISL